MPMRSLARLLVAVALLIGGAHVGAAQDVELAARGPRFLSTMTRHGAPLDASNAAVLQLRVSLDVRNVTAEVALDEIVRQARLELVYSKFVASLGGRVSVEVKNLTVAAALTEVLMGTGLDVLVSPGGQLALAKKAEDRLAESAPGSVVGRVTDAKTQTALVGATVVVEGTRHSATTGNDGRYRIADVAPGTYTVRARYIGYAPGSAAVTVSTDQEATADLALEKSAQRLNEVVTTGTVVPTEVKALPTPISVVTGDEIREKGYQRVDQIFRGDMPGAIAWDVGANNYLSNIYIRGSSRFGASVVKTYIDGVEVADPYFIANIDPSSIDRIEVLRGPQGSTLYGSQALSGVIQIFTKKGAFNTKRPQMEAKVSAGVIQSPSGNTATSDNSLSLSGGGSDFSYSVGGSYIHYGDWGPQTHQTNGGLYSSLRVKQGSLTADLSARYETKSFGYPPYNPALQVYLGPQRPGTSSVPQQTYSLTFTYAAMPQWQQTLVLGYDRTGLEFAARPVFATPGDSFFNVYNLDQAKASVAYHTTYEFSLAAPVRASLTAGADHWAYRKREFSAFSATTDSNTIPSPDYATRFQYSNTGYFAQVQLGFSDALFLTTGLRAEDNTNFGRDFGVAWAPRVGLSYVHPFGTVVAKARAAYGKAIRPPDPALAGASRRPSNQFLANPQLGPEQQRGWDAGVELYFGHRASLEVTHYDQTALDLISDVLVDPFTAPPTLQNQNVGRIKNTGWEFQGRLNAGPLSVAGTYSITNSVVRALSPSYSGDLQPGDHMLDVPKHTAGATLSYGHDRTSASLGMTWVGPWTESDYVALFGFYFGGQPYRGSGRAYWITYPSFTKLNLSLSQGITNHFNLFLQSENLTNKIVPEYFNYYLQHGRVTRLGVRTEL